MPATPEDAIPAPPATPQEPPSAAQAPSKLPPSIASAFAAAAYALQHGDPDGKARQEDNAAGQGLMPGLYASMVGPVSRDYYLCLFERFDTLGKSLPTWNAAAGLFTLPWCGLRGLWREGAAYALAAGGTAALWTLGLRPMLDLPPAIVHGMDATLVLLAIAIPGLGANALYWHHVRRHTLQAIGEAPTMAEAHERLARHAVRPARKRLAVLAGVLLATAGTAAAWALAVRATATPQAAASSLAASALVAAPPSAERAALQPVMNAAPTTPTSTPASTDTTAAAVTPAAAQPPAAPAQAPQTIAEAQASPPPQPPLQPAAATAPGVEPRQMVAAAVEPMAAAAPKPSRPSAPAPAATGKVAATPKPPEPAKDPLAKTPPAKAEAAKPASTALEPGNYYINIGVFSDTANAGRVVARLEKSGLPALRQTLHSNKGEIVRVRSGPFSQQHRADQAAARIRKMGMEATVFHHAPQEERSGRR